MGNRKSVLKSTHIHPCFYLPDWQLLAAPTVPAVVCAYVAKAVGGSQEGDESRLHV